MPFTPISSNIPWLPSQLVQLRELRNWEHWTIVTANHKWEGLKRKSLWVPEGDGHKWQIDSGSSSYGRSVLNFIQSVSNGERWEIRLFNNVLALLTERSLQEYSSYLSRNVNYFPIVKMSLANSLAKLSLQYPFLPNRSTTQAFEQLSNIS